MKNIGDCGHMQIANIHAFSDMYRSQVRDIKYIG